MKSLYEKIMSRMPVIIENAINESMKKEKTKDLIQSRQMTKTEIKKYKEEHPFGKFEDYKNELERCSKHVGKVDKKGRFEVEYIFGKNGSGLTKELMAIGDDIYRYSKKYFITFCNEPHFDSLDDVYDFKIYCQPHSLFEGSWGYRPDQSDCYHDWAYHLTKNLKKDFIKGLKDKSMMTRYSFMGLVSGFLENDKIWFETIDNEYKNELYDLFKENYEIMSAPDSEFAHSWEDEHLFREELEKLWKQFNKDIKKYSL